MKNILSIIILLILPCFTLMGQVAIGTDTPAPGTALHIEDATGTSGVLFPKVDIEDLATVAPLPVGTQDGTIVYNTNTTSGAGYYFFKDLRWEPIFGVVGGMAKFTNSDYGDTSEDLNGGGDEAQLFGNLYFNDNATVYQVVNNETLEVLEAGRYKVVINLSLMGTSDTPATTLPAPAASLLAVEARLQVNGATIGGIYRSNEMISLNSSAPDYSSIAITEIINLAANDELTVRVSRTQDNGDVFLRSVNTSSFFIERLD